MTRFTVDTYTLAGFSKRAFARKDSAIAYARRSVASGDALTCVVKRNVLNRYGNPATVNVFKCSHDGGETVLETRKHYHVVTGMGGEYSPNASYYCATRKDAESFAREEAERWRDAAWDVNDIGGYKRTDYDYQVVKGSARSGFYILTQPNNPYDLGEYIEIVECTDDCDPEEEYN